MWPAAFLALVFGGPLGVCLFIAAGITTAIKAWKVDAEAVKRGELPPTARLIDKWLDRRKAAGKAPQSAKPARYGMWRYAWQRWQAMWEDLGETHRDARNRYKQAVAEARRNGTQPPAKPTLKETLTGWSWQIDGPVAADTTTPVTAPAPDGSQSSQPQQPAGGHSWRCDTCGATGGGFATTEKAAEVEVWHVCPSTTKDPAAAAPGQPAAPAPNEGDTMPPARTGEVTGIPSAIQYLKEMSAAHQEHAANEALSTAFLRMNIGAGDRNKVQAAMAASANAAELYATAAASLQKNNAAVREGYASAPDAADKQHQMAE